MDVFFRELAKPRAHSSALPALGKHPQEPLRTNRKLSFIEKLLIKKDGKGTNNSHDPKDVCCHLA